MLDQSSAILAGVVASAIITPVVVATWKRIDPSQVPDSFELDADVQRMGKSIDRQAVIAATVFAFSCAYILGWSSKFGGITAVIFFSGVLAIPYLWTSIRCVVAGPELTNQYLLYYQTEHGVGVKLAKLVGLVSTYVLVVSVAVKLFWVAWVQLLSGCSWPRPAIQP